MPGAHVDGWVKTGSGEEKTRRLTVDIPASLHVRIKADCAMREKKMVEVVTALLLERFPPPR